MKISGVPQLVEGEKVYLKEWLVDALSSEWHLNERGFPLDGRLAIYVNGRPRLLKGGTWELKDNTLFLATGDVLKLIPRLEKVGMLVAVAGVAGLGDDPAILDAAAQAFAGGVKTKFGETFLDVIQSQAPVLGLAVSPDGLRMACKIGSDWKTIQGEIVPEGEMDGWLQIQ